MNPIRSQHRSRSRYALKRQMRSSMSPLSAVPFGHSVGNATAGTGVINGGTGIVVLAMITITGRAFMILESALISTFLTTTTTVTIRKRVIRSAEAAQLGLPPLLTHISRKAKDCFETLLGVPLWLIPAARPFAPPLPTTRNPRGGGSGIGLSD
jgi:hypothetical protein